MSVSRSLPGTARPGGGVAFLSYGFRPFFLLAGVAAVVLPAAWLLLLSGGRWPGAPVDPVAWHAHEMLYGFVAAAVAGFLLTAVPGFTGRPPLCGRPLLALAMLWLLSRVLAAFSGALPMHLAVIADTGFLLALAVVAARDVVAAGNRRNLVLVALVALLALASLSDHLQWHRAGAQAGLHVVLLLVTLLAGRIVPAFTRNWLQARARGPLPLKRAWREASLLACVVAAGLLDVFVQMATPLAIVAVAAAMLHALRLLDWRGWSVREEPLLAVLHVGVAWLVLGYVLLALSALELLPRAAALHAFGMGAFGTMILAVMTRAALGHTGRPLKAPRAAVAAYVLVGLAALARVAATLWPAAWSTLLIVSGVSWMASFTFFLVAYVPILLLPGVERPDAGASGEAATGPR